MERTVKTRPPTIKKWGIKGPNGVVKYTCYPNFCTIMLIKLSSQLFRVNVLWKDGSFKSDLYGVYHEALKKYLEACNA